MPVEVEGLFNIKCCFKKKYDLNNKTGEYPKGGAAVNNTIDCEADIMVVVREFVNFEEFILADYKPALINQVTWLYSPRRSKNKTGA